MKPHTPDLTITLFDLVRVYSWGSEKLLNKGINESFAILGKRKFCKNVYKKLKGYLIDIGDLLAWETENTYDPKEVVEGLEKLLDMLKLLFDEYHKDPERFKILTLPLEDNKRLGRLPESERTRKSNAIFEDWLDQTVFIPNIIFLQIGRVFSLSMSTRQEIYLRESIAHKALKILIRFLQEQSIMPNTEPFVKTMLDILQQMGREALRAREGYLAVLALVRPNIDLLSPLLHQSSLRDSHPIRAYRVLVIPRLRENLFLIVREGGEETNQELFRFLFHYSPIGSAGLGKDLSPLWEIRLSLENPLGKLANELEVLEERGKWLLTMAELESWESQFEKSWKAPELVVIESVEQIKQKILDFAFNSITFNTFLFLMMEFGAYCLFQKRYDLVRGLWEYKQPPDASATWCGHDLIPSSVDEILRLYWGFSEDRDRHALPIEGHHSLTPYFRRYSVLLLARTLADKMPGRGSPTGSAPFSLKCFGSGELFSAKLYVNELVGFSRSLSGEKELLDSLGFPEDSRESLLKEKVPQAIESFKKRCQDEIDGRIIKDEIDIEKVNQFKEDFLKSFNDMAVLRNVFKKHDAFEDLASQDATDGEGSFGIFQLDDKEMFLNETIVDYSGITRGYAEGMANGENADIIKRLQMQSVILDLPKQISPFEAFLKTLEKYEDMSGVYVIASIDWKRLFRRKGIYEYQEGDGSGERNNIDGFVLFNGYKVNCIVPRPSQMPDRETCLVMDMKHVGKLLALNPEPTDKMQDIGSPEVKDGFFFDICALSDSPTIRKKILSNPPEWLQKKGDKETQEAYLNTRVRIVIQEKFDFKFETEGKSQPGIYCLSLSSFSQEKSED